MEPSEAKQETPERLYTPRPDEPQLSVRAVAAGCLLGAAVVAMNLYLGLKIGWSEGGSLMAAILGFGFFAVLRPRKPYSVLEANITQTAGSGAGTMASAAGLLAPIPAMKMLGYEIPVWALFVWGFSIAYLGVMFAVPLRRQYVVIEKLRFPTGTATANTIMAMFATAGEAVAKAKVLLYFAIFSFFYIIAAYFIPDLEHPRVHVLLGSGMLATMAAWGFSVYLGPMLFGAGFLIGPRVGASLAAGAIVGWGLLGYLSQAQGWAPHPNPMVIHDKASDLWGPRGWILWPGVAIMVADALVSLALSWRTFVAAFRGTRQAVVKGGADQSGSDDIPNTWWTIGLAIASVSTIVLSWLVFGIPFYMSIMAILLSSILANVAVRSVGETDINPIGGMGKVSQVAFGLVSDSMSTNLMGAAVTGAGASQAGDMMQDLKTGHLLGASPRKQFKAQLVGIAAGVLFAVPVYLLYDHAFEIGGDNSQLGAPAALAWKAVAEVLSQGFDALPPFASTAVLFGLLFGGLIPIVRKLFPKVASYTPSGMAFGIAFIVHPYYSLVMFFGSMGLLAWRSVNRDQCGRFVFSVACGLIAGEGLAGMVNAVLTIAGVPPLYSGH
jgi:putative OPT family oligopeptide transporter